MPHFLLTVLITLLILGFILWLVNLIPFIAPPMKQIIQGVAVFCVVIWLIYAVYDAFWGGGVGMHTRGIA
jgi:hypothetical protein